MKKVLLLFLVLAWIGSRPAFAETWTGYLVDSKCYASEQGNVNPFDGSINVNSDRGYQIRACRPDIGTTSFALVGDDGRRLKLDTSGNARAANLIQQTGKKDYTLITVTGEKIGDTLKVDSISLIDAP
jgi:hypothetical protein